MLQPVDAYTTRLVLWDRQASMGNPVVDTFMDGLVGPVGFMMTRKMREGIADRAEAAPGPAVAGRSPSRCSSYCSGSARPGR